MVTPRYKEPSGEERVSVIADVRYNQMKEVREYHKYIVNTHNKQKHTMWLRKLFIFESFFILNSFLTTEPS
jgi:hypothetical protein